MFSIPDYQTLHLLSITFNSFSFLGCLILLCFYSRSSFLSGTQFHILKNIAFSDCLLAATSSLTFLLEKENLYYPINQTLSLVALWSSAFWSTAFTVFLYQKLAHPKELDFKSFYSSCFRVWVLACLSLPIAFILIAFCLFGTKYSIIGNSQQNNLENLILFIGFEALPFVIYLLVSFIYTFKQIKVVKQYDFLGVSSIASWKLLKYSITQCLIFLPCLICRSIFFVSPFQNLVLDVFRLFGYDIAGLTNSIVYGLQHWRVQQPKDSLLNPKVFPESIYSRRTTIYDEEANFDYVSLDEDLSDFE